MNGTDSEPKQSTPVPARVQRVPKKKLALRFPESIISRFLQPLVFGAALPVVSFAWDWSAPQPKLFMAGCCTAFALFVILAIAELQITDAPKTPDFSKWDKAFARDLQFQIDGLMHQRVNFFLAAEAVLFAAFASGDEFKAVLSALGLILTFSFWYSIARLYVGLSFLEDALNATWPCYKDYTEFGKGGPSSYLFLVWVVPASTFFAWAVLFLKTTGSGRPLLLIGGTAFLALVVIVLLAQREDHRRSPQRDNPQGDEP